jgi:hypothetical protein
MEFPHTSPDIKASEFRILQHSYSPYRRRSGSPDRSHGGADREPATGRECKADVALQHGATRQDEATDGGKLPTREGNVKVARK